jgi:hypothetical protein
MAAMALGIDVGWRPLSEGGVEYLIQIEPDLLETLQPGEAIGSDVPPPLVGQIRAYRITVGTEELPRELPSAIEVRGEIESPGLGAREAGPPGLAPFSALPEPTPSPGIGPPGGSLPPLEEPLPESSSDSEESEAPVMPLPGSLTPGPGEVGEPGGAGPQPRSWPRSSPPNLLPDVSARKPMKAEQAVFQVPNEDANPSASEKGQQEAATGEKPKPWTPLVVTLLGLFASLGANVFLGWMALDFRSRYQGLVRRS